MTCVLSVAVPPLYTSPFIEGGEDLQNNGYDSFDFNWINYSRSSLSDNQTCSDKGHVEEGAATSISCRMEMKTGFLGSDKQQQYYQQTEKHQNKDIASKHITSGPQNVLESCNKIDGEQCQRLGIKRKAEEIEPEEAYIPSKRVSPYLNTPKERKEKRKKILKISLKKLKRLNDPEAFLRKTVLVNNITKHLQSEIRHEKVRTKKVGLSRRKSINANDVNNNNCVSDSYLCDDPFFSEVQEKITDDMTDTFISNVLQLHETSDKDIHEIEPANRNCNS